MSLFDISQEAPQEKISTEVVLLPAKTAIEGKITGYRVQAQYVTDPSKKTYQTVWVRFDLNVACSGVDLDFEEVFGVREKTISLQVRTQNNRNGLPLTTGNEFFGALMKEFDIDASDKELLDKSKSIEREDYPEGEDGDIAFKVAQVKAWWESLGERFKDIEVIGKTGIDKGFGDNPRKSNILSEIHPAF